MSFYENQEATMREQDRIAQNTIAEAYGLPIPYPSGWRAAEMQTDSLKSELAVRDAKIEKQAKRIKELEDTIECLFTKEPADHGRAKRILADVSKQSGIPLWDLLSPRRNREVVYARQSAMWKMKHNTTLSLGQIGKLLGGMDHTSVLYGIREHQKRTGGA